MTAPSSMDYLDVLAAKSLGLLHGVRPRMPSLFEPAPRAITSGADGIPTSRLVPGVSYETTSGAHAYRRVRDDVTAELFDSHVSDDSAEHRQLRRRAEVRSARGRPVLPTADAAEGTAAQASSATSVQVSAELGSQPESHAARIEANPIEPAAARPRSTRQRAPLLQESVASPILRADVHENAPPRAATPSAPSLLRSEPPRSVEPVRPVTARLGPEETWATPVRKETVVQVTIGRVEVKAIVAPTPTVRKPPPSPPVMSLDEYLQRRGGRGAS